MNEKLDLKKVKKDLFSGKNGEIKEVFCKKAYYLAIDGEGDPNIVDRYKDAIEALYGVVYTLKFMYKDKGLDFVVMPLSGLWWSDSEVLTEENKSFWKWRSMMEIPGYIIEEDIEVAKKEAYAKKKII